MEKDSALYQLMDTRMDALITNALLVNPYQPTTNHDYFIFMWLNCSHLSLISANQDLLQPDLHDCPAF